MLIQPIASADDLAAVRTLFQEYAASLEVDLAYQGFAEELAGLPGKYAPPAGALLIARGDKGHSLGCVALRRLAGGSVCEMKRLYVRPAARGLGLGRRLAEAIIHAGRGMGYAEMRLDTLPSMAAAFGLYEELGFRAVEPYYDTPIRGTRFLGRRLSD